jgi:hypothetical protein
MAHTAPAEAAFHQLAPDAARLPAREHEEFGELERPIADDAPGVADGGAALLRDPRMRGGAGEMIEKRPSLGPELVRHRRGSTPAAERFHPEPEAELVDGRDEDREQRARIVGPRASKRERHTTSERVNAE